MRKIYYLILFWSFIIGSFTAYKRDKNNTHQAPQTSKSYFPINTTQIGTQAFGANYTFDTSKTSLVEQADVVHAAGFKIFKFGIGDRVFKDYEINRSWEESWYDLPSMKK